MINTLLEHIKIILFFGFICLAISFAVYWIDVYFERKINYCDVLLYADEDECIFGDDEMVDAIRRATVIDHIKKKKR